jgi:hypothetical protein
MLTRRAANPAVSTARARRNPTVGDFRDRIRPGSGALTHRPYPMSRCRCGGLAGHSPFSASPNDPAGWSGGLLSHPQPSGNGWSAAPHELVAVNRPHAVHRRGQCRNLSSAARSADVLAIFTKPFRRFRACFVRATEQRHASQPNADSHASFGAHPASRFPVWTGSASCRWKNAGTRRRTAAGKD